MEYRLLVATRLRLTVNITDFGMLILHSLLSPSLSSCSLWHHYPSSPRLCVLQTPSPTLPLIEYYALIACPYHLCSPVQVVDPVIPRPSFSCRHTLPYRISTKPQPYLLLPNMYHDNAMARLLAGDHPLFN